MMSPCFPENSSARLRTAAASRLRLLLVDEDADLVQSLALLLRLRGHEVRAVGDGGAAFDAALEYQPHVIVLELRLRGINGYELARLIRSTPAVSGTLLVAYTGFGRKIDRKQVREAGFDYHIIKPADPDLLIEFLSGFAGRQPPGYLIDE